MATLIPHEDQWNIWCNERVYCREKAINCNVSQHIVVGSVYRWVNSPTYFLWQESAASSCNSGKAICTRKRKGKVGAIYRGRQSLWMDTSRGELR